MSSSGEPGRSELLLLKAAAESESVVGERERFASSVLVQPSSDATGFASANPVDRSIGLVCLESIDLTHALISIDR
jgi:hypothetical protein